MSHLISWNVSISMSFEAFQSVNVPLSVVSIFMDMFFVSCMLFPAKGQQRMKQPFSVLVGSLVGCNTTLHFCTILFVSTLFTDISILTNTGLHYITAQCLLFTMRTSITSCLWLNVFYYCQIVPAQRPFFIFLKKNIRPFVYSTLILDKFIFLFGIIVNAFHDSVYSNVLNYLDVVDLWIRLGYFLLSLFVMLSSSCVTILYLRRHINRMEESSRSSPHLRSQLRVTITGIVQTVLYFLCSVWLIIDDVAYFVVSSQFDLDAYILCTVISVYSFGTNINLGVGQSIFREQIIFVWQKLFEMICALLA